MCTPRAAAWDVTSLSPLPSHAKTATLAARMHKIRQARTESPKPTLQDAAALTTTDLVRESHLASQVASLQQSLVALDNAHTESTQAHASALAARADEQLTLVQQLSLLKCQLEAAHEQLRAAQLSEIDCRNRAIVAQAQADDAHAAAKVLEARLEASARREMALQTAVARQAAVHQMVAALATPTPVASAQPTTQPPPCNDHVETIKKLHERVAALDQTVMRAEWGRVEAEKHALALEQRLEHSLAEAAAANARVAALVDAADAKDRALVALNAQQAKAPPVLEPVSLKLLDSKLAFAERNTLRAVRESALDLQAVLHIVQCRLENRAPDMDVVLPAHARLPADDAERLAAVAEDLKARARQVRLALVDRLADEERGRCHVQ